MHENKGLFSILLFSYFSEKRLETATEKITATLEAEQIPFEIVIIDDGSKDDSFAIAKQLAAGDERIRAYQLSRNYTTPYSQFAGFSVCKGACAATVPDDLQRPLSSVVQMYRIWEQGNKLVVGYRNSRDDGKFNDLFSNLYYKVMNRFSEIKFPPGGADGFLADREIINILNERIHPINTSPIVEVLRMGFDPVFVPYDRPKAAHKSRWTFQKKWRLAMNTFFASSTFPIRLIGYLGMLAFLFSFLLILILIVGKIAGTDRLLGFSIPGWTSTGILIATFSGLNMLCMAILAEYIWRIFDEVKARPGYLIRENEEEDE